jgi:hypothetical protein
MKKILLLASVLSIATLGYAGEGCGSGCGGKKSTESGPAKPADKAPEAPKS